MMEVTDVVLVTSGNLVWQTKRRYHAWKMYLKSIFVFFCFSIFCNNGAKRGKLYIRSVENCNMTGRIYDHDSPVSYNISVLNDTMGSSYATAHINILRRTLPVTFNFRSYRVNRKGERVLNMAIENVGCRNPVAKAIMHQLKVKYNAKECYGHPGKYHMKKFNIEDVLRVYKYLFDAIEYILFAVEFDTAEGLIVCFEAKVVSVP